MNPIPASFTIPSSFNPSSLGLSTSPTAGASSQLNDDSYFLISVSQALDSDLISADLKSQVMNTLINSDLASINLDERAAIVQAATEVGGPNMTGVQRSMQAHVVVALIASSSNNQGSGSTSFPAPTAPTHALPGFAVPVTTLPVFGGNSSTAPALAAPTPLAAPATPATLAAANTGMSWQNGPAGNVVAASQFGMYVREILQASGMLSLNGSPNNNQFGVLGMSPGTRVAMALTMLDTSALTSEGRVALLEMISAAVEDQNITNDEINEILRAAGPQSNGVRSMFLPSVLSQRGFDGTPF